MDFNEYQKLASRTADFTGVPGEYPLMYAALGLAGESGELIEKIKKIMRNDGGSVSEEKKISLTHEIGDVLWYLSQIARLLDVPFAVAAQANIDKLADRAKRDVIRSEGDTR